MEDTIDKNLIPLQSAYITKGIIKNEPWKVCNADTDEILTELDGNLDNREGMSYLHFARPFELSALNIGIRHGKKIEQEKYDKQIKALGNHIKWLEEENLKLSNTLERLISAQED